MQIEQLIYLAPVAGAIALAYAFLTTGWVNRQDAGNDRMKNIAEQIFRGAMAFLSAEYRVLALFVLLVAGALTAMYAMTDAGSPLVGLAFVVGAFCSALAGWFGMRVATRANVRTAAAARSGLPPALKVAFRGGAVMGMCVVGLALVGFGALFAFFVQDYGIAHSQAATQIPFNKIISIMAGFSMGASSIALFARV
ncbi:MAG: sodium/proton-translocating pyrophosphatase, partial [Myxococcales bacterium]|nr:sodium/proton-translocating pyrophosphatase [Myxococcales bacterium]